MMCFYLNGLVGSIWVLSPSHPGRNKAICRHQRGEIESKRGRQIESKNKAERKETVREIQSPSWSGWIDKGIGDDKYLPGEVLQKSRIAVRHQTDLSYATIRFQCVVEDIGLLRNSLKNKDQVRKKSFSEITERSRQATFLMCFVRIFFFIL